jgi:hypothetical protein
MPAIRSPGIQIEITSRQEEVHPAYVRVRTVLTPVTGISMLGGSEWYEEEKL